MRVTRAALAASFCILAICTVSCRKSAPPAPEPAASAYSLVLPAPAQGRAHLRGRVLQGTAPAAGIKMEVCTTPTCGNILDEKTDANGEYAFRDVAPGSYRNLTAYGAGDASHKIWPTGEDHEVAAGAVVAADATMP